MVRNQWDSFFTFLGQEPVVGVQVKRHSSYQETQGAAGEEKSLVRARLGSQDFPLFQYGFGMDISNLPWAGPA